MRLIYWISDLFDWKSEKSRGFEYARMVLFAHIFIVIALVFAGEFFIASSTKFSGLAKIVYGILILFIGLVALLFGRLVYEMGSTLFKVEKRISALHDLEKQNRIRPSLEIIEAHLKAISERQADQLLPPTIKGERKVKRSVIKISKKATIKPK
jgi:hypothetical protein